MVSRTLPMPQEERRDWATSLTHGGCVQSCTAMYHFLSRPTLAEQNATSLTPEALCQWSTYEVSNGMPFL